MTFFPKRKDSDGKFYIVTTNVDDSKQVLADPKLNIFLSIGFDDFQSASAAANKLNNALQTLVSK